MAVEIVPARERRVGKSLLDAKTPVHFATGIIGGLLGIDASVVVLSVLTFEAAKAAYRKDAHRALFQPGSAEVRINQAMDVGMTMLGAYIGERMRTAKIAKEQAAAQLPAEMMAPAPVAGPIAVSGLGASRVRRLR